ncbi:phage neck terminator protein, partial [Leptospira weilii]
MKFEDIKSVMDSLVAVLRVNHPDATIQLADQDFDKPEYPYGTYKVLVLNQDPTKSASSWIEATGPEDFKQVFRKNQHASISLAFLHNSSIATCFDLCERAMDWFDSVNGLAECETF